LLTDEAITLGTTPITISWIFAEEIEITGIEFTNDPAIPISAASASTLYRGTSALATLTADQVKSVLSPSVGTSIAGTYALAAGGYKYFAFPATMGAPTAIRDASTPFALALAGVEDGYSESTNGLSHAVIEIDGVSYRVYRSLNTLGGSISLTVS
jgi:hypothetical protein